MRSSPHLSRRGMSPLIATVLLMAFAVALGGMVMNWSGDFGGGQAALDCKEVTFDILQFCHDDAAINVNIRNTGDILISSVVLNIDTPGTGLFVVKLQESRLSKGSNLRAKIPFIVDDQASVSLVGNIDDAVACPAQETRKPLPKC